MHSDSLVSSDEIASHFGVTVGTVNAWVREDRIPYIRVSRRVIRFRISEVERAVSSKSKRAGNGGT